MLLSRIATALILAPLFLFGIFALPPGGFAVFIGVFLLLSSWEWGGLCGFDGRGKVLWTLVLALLAGGLWFGEALWPDARLAAALPDGDARERVRLAAEIFMALRQICERNPMMKSGKDLITNGLHGLR